MSDDDAADDLACLHGPEGVVDLVELDAAGDHRTEVEPAGLGEGDEAGEVPSHLGRAVDAAQELLLLVEKLEGRERHLRVHARRAHDRYRAAPASDVERLQDRFGEADDLERVGGAAST